MIEEASLEATAFPRLDDEQLTRIARDRWMNRRRGEDAGILDRAIGPRARRLEEHDGADDRGDEGGGPDERGHALDYPDTIILSQGATIG